MPDIRIVDPLSLPLVHITPESSQWLIDSKTVDPSPAGIFAGLVPGKVAAKTPVDLQKLGLIKPTTSTDTIDRSKIPYAEALKAVADPNRRLGVAWRDGETNSTATYFIKGRTVASGFVVDQTRSLSPAFSTALLSSALSRKMTGPDDWSVALPPRAIVLIRQLFTEKSQVLARTVGQLNKALAPGGLAALLESEMVVQEGDTVSLAPDALRIAQALASGQVLVVDVTVFDSPPPDAHRNVVFVGAPGHRLWTYDQPLPKGGESSIFRSLDPKTAADLAGALVGL